MKVVTIGRSKEYNDIVVNDDKVSRNHLQMVMDDNGNYSVLDLNSTNGTYVNGKRISGQVPLKETDELRIGNTVLSWQCYFGSQPQQVPNNPVPPKAPIEDPSPNRWLIYIIIGAVLLLAGGGFGLKRYLDNKYNEDIKAVSKTQEDNEKQKQQELAEAQRAATQADLEYEKARRKAAETNSKDDLAYAEKMKQEANDAHAKLDILNQQLNNLNEENKNLTQKNTTLSNQNNSLNKTVDNQRDSLKNARDTHKQDEKTINTLQLTQRMQNVLNSWDDSKAAAYCKQKNWSTKNTNARAVITEKFSQIDADRKKEAMIEDMKAFNPKKKEEDPKKTETQSESQPAPAVTQPDTNN